MEALNLYSLGHLLLWFAVGSIFRMGWPFFLVLSIGWELLEWVLPYEFAVEGLANKFADILVNCLGFSAGRRMGERYKMKEKWSSN